MSDSVKGFWALLASCAIWGLSGIYYKALSDVPAFEILAHRTVWSVVFLGAVLAVQGGLAGLRAVVLETRTFALVALAALAVSINWVVFIWAEQSGHAVDASLGYFILPLVSVAFGVTLFHERLSRAQVAALTLAAVAVAYMTVEIGSAPWVALSLALSFSLYGVFKKGLAIPSLVSVTAEVALLAPIALVFLLAWEFGWGLPGGQGVFGHDLRATLLLPLSGPLSGVPLLLFSYAAQKVKLSTMGIGFYLNPTLQLLVAVLIFGEPLLHAHVVAFPLIWIALAVYTVAGLRRSRAESRG
uniref:EamA family transporter RarD n=1 Tax=Paenirhodobacter enshiensis TaxID=1105367 RepID=UPI0035AD81E3